MILIPLSLVLIWLQVIHAGKDYQNSDEKLPRTDSTGKEITYREFDVNNYNPGQSRDGERFVVGSDGSKYYTDDHYESFTQIK
ncbi:hypothetical protein F1904_12410 [Akkermansia muciniphila]|nr:hypothetical protein F1904_12410 [Akkermansia muciniphila]